MFSYTRYLFLLCTLLYTGAKVQQDNSKEILNIQNSEEVDLNDFDISKSQKRNLVACGDFTLPQYSPQTLTLYKNTGLQTINFVGPIESISNCEPPAAIDPDFYSVNFNNDGYDQPVWNSITQKYDEPSGGWKINQNSGWFNTDGYSITFNTNTTGFTLCSQIQFVGWYVKQNPLYYTSNTFYSFIICPIDSIITDFTLTGTTINYTLRLGPQTYPIDTFISSSPDYCGYTSSTPFTYFIRTVGSIYTAADLSLSVSNKAIIANTTNIISPQTFQMQWWLVPTSCISSPFPLIYHDFNYTVSYLNLVDAQGTQYNSTYQMKLGSTLTLNNPVWTTTPSNFITYFQPGNFSLYIDNFCYQENDTRLYVLPSWLTVNSTALILNPLITDISEVGVHNFNLSWTWTDDSGIQLLRTFNFTVEFISCQTAQIFRLIPLNPTSQCYIINNSTVTWMYPTFTQLLACANTLTYSFLIDGLAIYPPWFTDVIGQIFTISASSSSFNGTHNVTLTTTSVELPSFIDTQSVIINFYDQAAMSITGLIPIQTSLNYVIGDAQVSINYPTFIFFPDCLNDLNYTLLFDGISTIPSQWLNNVPNSTLQIYTSDIQFIGTHNITITTNSAAIPSFYDSQTLILTFICYATSIQNLVALAPTSLSYVLGSGGVIWNYPTFTQSPACGNPLTYSLLIDGIATIPVWLNNVQNTTFTVNSSDLSLIGTHNITITTTSVSLTSFINIQSVTLIFICQPLSLSNSMMLPISVSYNILDPPLLFNLSTYVQSPACGLVPQISFKYDTNLSGSFVNAPSWLTANVTQGLIYSYDKLLAGQTLYLRQQNTYGTLVIAQTMQVQFTYTDPCPSSQFLDFLPAEKFFQTTVSQALQIPIPTQPNDSISSQVGSNDGYSFCGARQIQLIDLESNTTIDLNSSIIFSLVAGNLVFLPNSEGQFTFLVQYYLVDYPSIVSSPIKLIISVSKATTHPYFKDGGPALLYSLEAGKSMILSFEILEDDGGCFDITVSFISNLISQEITQCQQGKAKLDFLVQSNLTQQNVSISISIVIVENGKPNPQNLTSNFVLKVYKQQIQKSQQQQTKNITEIVYLPIEKVSEQKSNASYIPQKFKDLQIQIESISRLGLVNIVFNQPLNLIFGQDIVTYEQNSDEPVITFNWTHKSNTTTTVQVQFLFSKPLSVSVGKILDRFQIYLAYQFTNSTRTYQWKLVGDIPMLIGSEEELKKLTLISDTIQNVSKILFWLYLFLYIIFSFALSMLWGTFQTLQVIIAMPILKVIMPANVLQVFKSFTDIVNMKIVDSKQVYDLTIGRIVPKQQQPQANLTEFNPLRYLDGASDQIFEKENLVNDIVMCSLGLIILLLLISLIVFCQKYAYQRLPQSIKNLLIKIKGKLMWSSLLRYITQSYLDIAIKCMLTLYNFQHEDLKQKIFSCFISVYILIIPLFIWLILYRNRENLDNKLIKQQIGTLYMDYETDKKSVFHFTMVFLYRRLLFAFTVAFVSNVVMQIYIVSMSSLLLLIYIIIWSPMDGYILDFLTIFNEVVLLFASYLLFLYTEYVPSPELRYKFGNIMMYLLYFNFGLNILLLVFEILRQIIRHLQRWCYQRKLKKETKVSKQKKIENLELKIIQDLKIDQVIKKQKQRQYTYTKFQVKTDLEAQKQIVKSESEKLPTKQKTDEPLIIQKKSQVFNLVTGQPIKKPKPANTRMLADFQQIENELKFSQTRKTATTKISKTIK